MLTHAVCVSFGSLLDLCGVILAQEPFNTSLFIVPILSGDPLNHTSKPKRNY